MVSYHTNHLYHYGVKGMKWGVRRNKSQLKYDRGVIESTLLRNALKTVTRNGILITGVAEHALDRAAEKGRSITTKEIINTLKTPLHIDNVLIDSKGRTSQKFIGVDATVCINPDSGVIVSVWKTGSKRRRKYTKN